MSSAAARVNVNLRTGPTNPSSPVWMPSSLANGPGPAGGMRVGEQVRHADLRVSQLLLAILTAPPNRSDCPTPGATRHRLEGASDLVEAPPAVSREPTQLWLLPQLPRSRSQTSTWSRSRLSRRIVSRWSAALKAGATPRLWGAGERWLGAGRRRRRPPRDPRPRASP